jgi:hypothetical protein
MRGDDRTRYCAACSKHVYNVSDLTADEAVALIRENEGHLCVRLYRRKDGSVLTADCPVGIRSSVRRRLIRLATAGVVVIAMLRSGIWLFAEARSRFEIPSVPTGPGVTFSDWADWVARALGLKQPFFGGEVTFGLVCNPAPPVTYPEDGGEPGPDEQCPS